MNNVDLCRTLTDECFLLYTLHLINTGSKFNDIGLVMQLHGFSCTYLVSRSVLYIFLTSKLNITSVCLHIYSFVTGGSHLVF